MSEEEVPKYIKSIVTKLGLDREEITVFAKGGLIRTINNKSIPDPKGHNAANITRYLNDYYKLISSSGSPKEGYINVFRRKNINEETNRCQIARDITKDILHEQCKTEDDKCKIAKEITEDIVSKECEAPIEEYRLEHKKEKGRYFPYKSKEEAEKKAKWVFGEDWNKEYEIIEVKQPDFDRKNIDDCFYNFLQKDFDKAGYYIEYVNEDTNYMYFKLIDKKTNKKTRIIELSNDRLCKEVSAGRSKYLARDVIKEL